MQRVNSLKQAVRQLIEHTEKLIDDQSSQQCAAKGPSAVKMDFLKVGSYTIEKLIICAFYMKLLLIPVPGQIILFKFTLVGLPKILLNGVVCVLEYAEDNRILFKPTKVNLNLNIKFCPNKNLCNSFTKTSSN